MFTRMKQEFQVHVESMLENQTHLFVVDIDPDKLWNLYLENIPKEFNQVFRKKREHDCSGCKSFIRHFGNVVTIVDDKIISIWDFETSQREYQLSLKAMSTYIHQNKITDVFLIDTQGQGHDKDREKINEEIITWDHFYFKLPKRFVISTDKTLLNKKRGEYRDTRNVFLRSLSEITTDAVETVLELIDQNSLYKGEEWELLLQNFNDLQKQFAKITDVETWSWLTSISVGPVLGRIRNHSIGVLLQDVSNKIDLNEAVKRYEKIVAPTNYKRPKAIFTKKMIEQAQAKIVELGFENSLERRHAKIEDITVNNILFANKDSIKRMKEPLDVFNDLTKTIKEDLPNLERIESIEAQTFINDILPKLTEVEVLMENRLEPSLVSLIAPTNSNAPTLFKWNNPFSWAYNGNITDSMKQRVQKAGGNINGVLRFSIMWNENRDNNNDFDAHTVEPNGNHIYFPTARQMHRSSGMLDVDITQPFERSQVPDGGTAVENIVWTDKNQMPFGIYQFYVHNYAHNGGRSGFSAEIEFDGIIHQFNYDKELRQDDRVKVANIIFENGKFKIQPILPSTTISKTIWNIQTQTFLPVSTVMFSPNYWDNQNGIGHRHVFFMINDCLNESKPNGFFNEFLPEPFLVYKRVFEALGSKMKVQDSDNQLSGVGFSTTKRNYVVLRVKGSFNRVIKINF